MASSNAATPAPAVSGNGRRDVEMLGGSRSPDTATILSDQLDCFDSEALGVDPTEVETALALCAPVVLHEPSWRHLHDLGIRSGGMNGSRPLDALCVEEVVFLDGGRFEFCRDAGYGGRRVAIIIPARDEFGDLADLAAWHIESGKLALWRGRAAMFGAENVYAPRLGEPLKVDETVRDWLRAGREGVFVIDGARQRAAALLRMAEPLGVRTEAFGRRLREALTIRAPRIVVAAPARAAA